MNGNLSIVTPYKHSVDLQRSDSTIIQAKEVPESYNTYTDWILENFDVYQGDRSTWFNRYDGVIQWKNIPEEYVMKLDDIYAEFRASNDVVMSKTVFSRDVINKVDGVFVQKRKKSKVCTKYVVGLKRSSIPEPCNYNIDWITENFVVYDEDRTTWFNRYDGVIQWKNIPAEYVIKLDDIYADFRASNDVVMSKTVFSRDVLNKVVGVCLKQRKVKNILVRYVIGLKRKTSDVQFQAEKTFDNNTLWIAEYSDIHKEDKTKSIDHPEHIHQAKFSTVGYLYMIREREFVRLGEPVYKIGKSENFERRFKHYPKGSQIVMCVQVPNHHADEKTLINIFDGRFTRMSEYGREYYKGDENEMLLTFLDAVTAVHKSAKS